MAKHKKKNLHAIMQFGYHGFSIIILLLFILGVALSYLLGGYMVQQSVRNNIASHIITYGDNFTDYEEPVMNSFAEIIVDSGYSFEQIRIDENIKNWWMEVLDEQYNTVRVIGDKQTDQTHYATLDLMPDVEAPYSYSIAPFINESGETNILLFAIPSTTSIVNFQLTGN